MRTAFFNIFPNLYINVVFKSWSQLLHIAIFVIAMVRKLEFNNIFVYFYRSTGQCGYCQIGGVGKRTR
jgi:hypothetical protein